MLKRRTQHPARTRGSDSLRGNGPWPAEVARPAGDFALATVHRAQNTDDPVRLRSILDGFSKLGCPIIFPIHPRTQKMIEKFSLSLPKNLHPIEPQAYFEMLALIRDCTFVVTDSGGLQKETYYAGKRCLVLREETEWTELVELGVAKLVGADSRQIANSVSWTQQKIEIAANIYGDGKAGEKIVTELAKFLA